MAHGDDRRSSGWRAFWRSLPGVLTGVAGVIAAVGTISALFVGSDGGSEPEPAAPAAPAATQQAAAAAASAGGCLRRYFAGVPDDRVGAVEAGTTDYDVISASQTKTGTVGLALTRGARPIGAVRFAFVPESRVFRIESVVDARCRPVDDLENAAGGEPSVLQDSGTVRIGLAGGSYDLTTIAWGSAIRVRFLSVVP